MKLQRRVLLAQLPALLALLALLGLGGATLQRLGEQGSAVLRDNYRSVLAAQRLIESAERLDSAALFRVAGETEEADVLLARHRPQLEAELAVEERNITEPGEGEAAAALRLAWETYQRETDAFLAAPPEARRALYFSTLYPSFLALKQRAADVLAINQDAMARKSASAEAGARSARRAWLLGSALGLGCAALAGSYVSHRISAPLLRLSEGAARVGEGRLDVELPASGVVELDQLAEAFNRMTGRLREYRRQSEGELARAREAAQAAIESLTDPVLVLGVQGELRASNGAARAIGAEEDLLGLDPGLQAAVLAAHGVVVGTGQPASPTDFSGVVLCGPPAAERALLPHATPIYDAVSGGLVGVTVLLQDVTRLRRLDELKGDLVQTAAHELRTPLTSLGMALHLALDERVSGPLDAPLAELLSAAREDTARLRALVEDLLDLSRIQRGRVQLALEELPAAALLEEVVAGARAAAQAGQIKLEVDFSTPELRIIADPPRLRLALGNLVQNAIRHAPAGTEVYCRVRSSGSAARFEVDDAGPGVRPEDRARIFEPFVRGEDEAPGGAGLGLSIAAEIVAAHGGSIGVGEAELGGARFWIELPTANAPTIRAEVSAEVSARP